MYNKTMKIETRNLLNVATVADKLGVKRQFIWSLIKAEKFKPIVIDRTTFIQLGDVERYEPRTVGRPKKTEGVK